MKFVVVGIVVALVATATAGATGLITGRQIKNGSIGLADLSSSAKHSLHGARGTAGPQGAQGPQGPAGGVSGIQVVKSPDVSIASGDSSYGVQQNGGPALDAQCPAGTTVVGTGFDDGIGSVGFVLAFGSLVGGFVYNDTTITITASVQAFCASSGGAQAASNGSARTRFLARARAASAALHHHR